MPDQHSLAGFDAPPPPKDRLFFAIFPDADTAARMKQTAQRLRTKHGLKSDPLEAQRFHVTLHHLGDHAGLPQEIVAAATRAATTVAMPPFEIVFDRVLSFSRKNKKQPFVLCGGDGVAALTAFQQALGTAMTKAGLGRWVEPRFRPHATLLYDHRLVIEEAVEAIRWTAQEFVLVHSLLGKTVHVPLARWPLRG